MSAPRVFLAGHEGMVGRALGRAFGARGVPLLTAPRRALDLRSQADVDRWFDAHRPDWVLLAAAKVGGIAANIAAPSDFILENLLIEAHVIEAALRYGVRRLLFLGSSCIYPVAAPLPLTEDALFDGPPEPTNAPYAVAKLAGVAMCRAANAQHGVQYLTVIPPNLYGPFDRFDPARSHVVPALMLKLRHALATDAPSITLWGDGTARRELLHVDDLARACAHLLLDVPPHLLPDVLNVGAGADLSIGELAQTLAQVTGFRGAIHTDPSQPTGARARLLDAGRALALGVRPQVALRDGLAATWRWLLDHHPAPSGASAPPR